MPSHVGASAHLRQGAPWVLALALAACAAPAPVAPGPGATAPMVQVGAQWPPKDWPASTRYALQGAGFAEADLRQVQLRVYHADGAGGVVQDGLATADVMASVPSARLLMSVPAGPNRWASLTGLNAVGQPVASLMSAASLLEGNSFELGFDGLSHATGRAIAAWKPSGAALGDQDQVPRLRAFIQQATGYQLGTNTHSGPNPYAFRARALGLAAAADASLLDAPATGAFLTEGWGRVTFQATANGQPLEAGRFTVTLHDPISLGERIAPAGSSFAQIPPGAWAYKLESLTGTVWGLVEVLEGQEVKVAVPVDQPLGGLGPQVGAPLPTLAREALGSAWWPTGQNFPLADGVVVAQGEGGASQAFALRLGADPSGQVSAMGLPVPLPDVAQRGPIAVWGLPAGGDVFLYGLSATGRLSHYKTTSAQLAAGAVGYLGDLPATMPVMPFPGQVAIATGGGRSFSLHASGGVAVLTEVGQPSVAVRLGFPARQLALAVLDTGKPWVAAEVEATGGQSLILEAVVDPASGRLDGPRLHGGPADDLRAPALVEVAATGVALAYERHEAGGARVAFLYRDNLGQASPEFLVPPSVGVDQILPRLDSAGPGTPPWLSFAERPLAGGPVALRVGQLGLGAFLTAQEGLADVPGQTRILPLDAPLPGSALSWLVAFHVPDQVPLSRPLARSLPPQSSLPALLP